MHTHYFTRQYCLSLSALFLLFVLWSSPYAVNLCASTLVPEQTDTIKPAATQNAEVQNGLPLPQKQLLIEKEPQAVEDINSDIIPGPGDFLNNMLHYLSKESDESKNQLEQLWAGIPTVIPDLYNVFLTL